MRTWVISFVAVFMLVAGPSGVQARGKTVRAAILPVDAQDLPAKLANRLQGLIARELKAMKVFRVVPARMTWNKIKRLKKRKIFVAGCTEKPRCVKTVGRNLRAKVLYRLKVSKAEEGFNLSLTAYDVKSGKEIRSDSEKASDRPTDIDRATRWVSRMVSSPMLTTLAKGKGRLQVNCSQKGADLYLNGKSFGKRTGKSFKVSSGVFDIQVKKEGFEPFHDVVVVRVGQKKVVKAVLVKSAETKPVEVAVAPLTPVESEPPPKEKAAGTEPEKSTKPETKTSDLPAWAVFEKPKAQEKEKKPEGGEASSAAVMPWQKPKKAEPYLPGPEKEQPAEVESGRKDETRFYQTWWFWTLIGVGAAAAGGTVAYFTLFQEEGSVAEGAALVQWE